MSISSTLSNALTGLNAASRAAQVVSSNVSNAMTDGYARRELDLSARAITGSGDGVQVDGIRRVVDETILRDRRLADAAVGEARVQSDFARAALDIIGLPGDAGSLAARVASLEAALLEAASRPDSDVRLATVLDAATGLTESLNNASNSVQQLRIDADQNIENTVIELNDTLAQIAEINGLILSARASGQDSPGLEDQRQVLVDRIAQSVPVRQIPRDNGTIALYSMGGALLLDGKPAEFGFQNTDTITADMTLASGALSGLTLNGEPVNTSGGFSPITGGVLSALFAVRDEQAIDAQDALDSIARDLISRFESTSADPTLNPGDPGLFTDGGGVLDPTDVIGLSGRIGVNTLVNPSNGGDLSLLRDGLGAGVQGPLGNSEILNALGEALSSSQAPVGGGFSATLRTFSQMISDLTSRFGQADVKQSNSLAFQQSRQSSLRDTELANGVDTDQEMQKLLLIEQAYAANARVIRTADQLIQTLLEI